MKYLLILALTGLFPIQILAGPTPPLIMAPAYILQDFHSGQVLMERNADKRINPASLTKLMTAYLVFEQLKTGKVRLSDTVRVSKKAWKMKGSRMFIEVDTRISVELLLQGLIISSGNDASVALAEYIGGTEEAFVTLMNKQADTLDLTNTHFANSSGLTAEYHYSSVRDLMILAQTLIQKFPEYYHWYSMREFTYNKILQKNRNQLLWHDTSIDGMKTGYTQAAGYCLVASAQRGKMRLISVIVGASSKKERIRDSGSMLDYGFRFFETYRPFQAQQVLDTQRIWQGNKDKLPLGLDKPLYVTVPKGQYKQLNAQLHIEKHIMAPVSAGNTYGALKIRLNDKIILERPLVALSPVAEGNVWDSLIDSILLFFIKKL
ncbi:MAG: D-alanyl-D-alanine carboxypeptidase [Thiomargarita sp.]|nr:D-alanyl-D-alanine carboxypeptidase [Thiomargarita sp.]